MNRKLSNTLRNLSRAPSRIIRMSALAALAALPVACDRISDIPDLLLPLAASDLRPRVIASSPGLNQDFVDPTTPIFVDFDREMDQDETRDALIITGDAPPEGTPRWAGRRLYYDLEDPLTPGRSYTLKVDASAASEDGTTMGIEYIVSFVAGSRTDAPVVLSSQPINNAQGVARDASVTINFSRPMDRESVEAAFRIDPSAAGEFIWSDDSTSFEYQPYSLLNFAATYAVRISVGALDQEGIALAETYNLSFQVGSDFQKPSVVDVRETGAVAALNEGDAGIFKDSGFRIRFSEAMDFSVTEDAVSLTRADTGAAVSSDGTWNAGFTQLTYQPSRALEPLKTYRLKVSTGAKDEAGNAMETSYSVTFSVDNAAGALNSNYLSATLASKIAPDGVEPISLTAVTPVDITATGAGTAPTDITIRLTFSHSLAPASVADAASIRRLFGIDTDSASVSSVSLGNSGANPNDQLTIVLGGLRRNAYELTIAGGRNGLLTIDQPGETGTWLEEDVKLYFKVND